MFSKSEAYESFMGKWSRRLAPIFLEFAGLKDGDLVLDVGSGTGSLASSVLSITKHSRVTGIDPSTDFVNYANSQITDERATFEKGDGQKLRFQDNSFDKTLSLLVINFIPDPRKALHEMVRTTKPRGLVAAAVWDYGEGMEMLRIFWDEAVALDPSIEPRDERHMPLCKSDQLAELWHRAGLQNVEVAPLDIQMEFDSFEDFWKPFQEGQGPAGSYVQTLNFVDQKKLKARIFKRIETKNGSGKIVLTGRAWAVKGTVPK